GYNTLADFQHDLNETNAHRPEVTPAIRAAQLGIQAAVLVAPLSALFALTFIMAPFLVMMANIAADQADAPLQALDDPENQSWLKTSPELAEPLKHPQLKDRLVGYRDRMRESAESRRSMLFAPQRFVLEQFEQHLPEDVDRQSGYPVQVREA